jgi:hypothetical protein
VFQSHFGSLWQAAADNSTCHYSGANQPLLSRLPTSRGATASGKLSYTLRLLLKAVDLLSPHAPCQWHALINDTRTHHPVVAAGTWAQRRPARSHCTTLRHQVPILPDHIADAVSLPPLRLCCVLSSGRCFRP